MDRKVCQCNKTRLINTNAFRNQDKFSSSPVQLEDLTIYIELQTNKKARTILVSNKEGDYSQSKNSVTVNFIDGSNVSGLGDEKYLTTKFTELTTVFDGKTQNSETLGITSIDVDFNTSYAPLITINFVDLKGSSIFQNDDNIINGTNPYSVFFELPYPLYTLKIKGYYGKTVQYCLHMTKFTSRFNSQTGNFEITASFIGYTYAMLSDMLIGVLKAIPYTDRGKTKYDYLRDPNKGGDPTLLTLNELKFKLEQINIETNKILKNNNDYIGISNYYKSLESLKIINNNINTLGNKIDIEGKNLERYDYFVVKNETNTSQNVPEKSSDYFGNYNTNITTEINSYNSSIENSALEQLNNESFNLKKLYDKNTIAQLKETINLNNQFFIFLRNNNYTFADDVNITVYDNTEIYKILDQQINQTNDVIENLKKKVAQTLSDDVSQNLKFKPTVRNIVRTFTTAVEVYLSCLYDVSSSAANDVIRKNELKNKFKDITKVDYTDLNTFYPWPTYLEGGVEKYLGDVKVLNDPRNVNEIRFINDLYNAFINEAQDEKNFDALIKEEVTNWVSTNPLDSRYFNDLFPYRRAELLQKEQIAILVMIRAMVFLGFSNTNLTNEEITTFAKKEVETINNSLLQKKLLLDFAATYCSPAQKIKPDEFLNVTGTISNEPKKVVEHNNDKYSYEYISGIDGKKVIPITKDFFNVAWDVDYGNDISNYVNNGNYLLTNYQTAFNVPKPYLDDGGTYIKIFDPIDFNAKKNPLSSTPPSSDIKIKLEELKKFNPDPKAANFNAFAGSYGVQEFTDLDYGLTELKNLAFRYVFLADKTDTNNKYINTINGLALTRNVYDLKNNPRNSTTKYDTNDKTKDSYNAFINIIDYKNLIYGADIETDPLSKNDRVKSITPTYNHYLLGDNRNLVKEYSINNNTNITYPYVNFNVSLGNEDIFSLFGSRLYNKQTSEESKAFLFLHTFPWNGLTGQNDKNSTIFTNFEIQNIFNKRAGFISAPKLWVAFIGGLIWRYDTSIETGKEPINFYDPNGVTGYKSYVPIFGDISPTSNSNFYPQKNEFLTVGYAPMSFGEGYKPIDPVILSLPEQAKTEFKNAFLDFVKNDWLDLKKYLEIYNGTDWDTNYLNLMNTNTGAISVTKDNNNKCVVSIDKGKISDGYSNFDQYITFSPIIEVDETSCSIKQNSIFSLNIFLELKDNSHAVKSILISLTNEVIIANTSPNIWIEITDNKKTLNTNTNSRTSIVVDAKVMENYLKEFINAINPDGLKSIFDTNDEKQIRQNIFGTTNENVIKFMLYKSCKNIYDKWIGDVKNDSIIFQCGSRNVVDSQQYKMRKPNLSPEEFKNPKLIDSFRFVTRSFRDIGDELAINPLPVIDYLKNNPNTSFYDAVTHLLSSNNFDFIALPNFINYNDPKVLETVFDAYPYDDSITDSGPSFVCVYLGEKSKNLDFGKSSAYANDGFDVICDENGNLPNLPTDLAAELKENEEAVTFFDVTFGQQNQNIFKDVTLDQSEFSETAESLKIMDAISNSGSETSKNFAGQNIYNVYSIRSYKVEVEMLGDAMIQPMMYFQLNNIPMFHGAYMITRVKHNIKPNHMSTHFTGVRIRKPETKIFDLNELYMSLLDTIKTTQPITKTTSKVFGQSIDRSYPPIVATIINNGGTNGNIVKKNIKTKKVEVPSGVKNMISDTPELIDVGVDSLKLMLTDWVSWMKANGFVGNNGVYALIISAFRTYEQQVQTKNKYGDLAAEPGNSNHGWGIAVDFQFYRKNGIVIDNYVGGKPNLKEGYDFSINESLAWLVDNSYTYGWIIPDSLRDDSGIEEFWHFEYHGKSAACILAKIPIVKGRHVDTSKPYKDIVKNPLDENGKEAAYTKCDFVTIKRSADGTNDVVLTANDKIVIVPPSTDDIAFYNSILRGLDAPLTDENRKFFYAWRQAENGTAAWNPFNTTQKSQNTTNYNCNAGYPVKNYASRELGIKATIDTISNGYYPKIHDGLKNNVGAYTLSTYINELTKWGTGHGVNKQLSSVKLAPPPISNYGKTASCS